MTGGSFTQNRRKKKNNRPFFPMIFAVYLGHTHMGLFIRQSSNRGGLFFSFKKRFLGGVLLKLPKLRNLEDKKKGYTLYRSTRLWLVLKHPCTQGTWRRSCERTEAHASVLHFLTTPNRFNANQSIIPKRPSTYQIREIACVSRPYLRNCAYPKTLLLIGALSCSLLVDPALKWAI